MKLEKEGDWEPVTHQATSPLQSYVVGGSSPSPVKTFFGMFQDDPSRDGHISIWSEGPGSTSVSPEGPLPLIRGEVPTARRAHQYPDGFWHMAPEMPGSPVRKMVDVSDEFGLSGKFSGISIRDKEEDEARFDTQFALEQSDDPYGSWFDERRPVGSKLGNVVTKSPYEDCRNVLYNVYGRTRDTGVANSAVLDEERRLSMLRSQQYHRMSSNLFERGVSSDRLNDPLLYRVNSTDYANVQWKQAIEHPSDEGLTNFWLPTEASFGINSYYPNTANVISGAPICNACFCSQQNRSNSNGDCGEKKSLSLSHMRVPNLPLGIGYEPLYGSPMFNDRVRTTPSGSARQLPPPMTRDARRIGAFSCEDSLIIQGKDLDLVGSDGDYHLKEHKRSSYNSMGMGRSCEKDLELAENGCVPRMHYSSLFPSKYNSLQEVKGCIYFIAKDQLGCRLLQRKLDEGTPEDVQLIFNEIISHAVELMVNSFGNYLIQRLLEVCTEEQRLQFILVATAEPGRLVKISLNMHGTRVVQKLIETLKTKEQISLTVSALEPGFLDLTRDLNGNHVVQRCLEKFSNEDNKFIFKSAAKYCVNIATHQHGCCVLQRCIIHSVGEHREKLVGEISSNGFLLAQDACGNYVIQCLLELKIPLAISDLISQFEGNYVYLSMQKFSSNVVQKCLFVFDETSRSRIIHELLATSQFERLLQDPFANYVIQSALEVSKVSSHKLDIIRLLRNITLDAMTCSLLMQKDVNWVLLYDDPDHRSNGLQLAQNFLRITQSSYIRVPSICNA